MEGNFIGITGDFTSEETVEEIFEITGRDILSDAEWWKDVDQTAC